jgi:PAS domain S-box-containing protein
VTSGVGTPAWRLREAQVSKDKRDSTAPLGERHAELEVLRRRVADLEEERARWRRIESQLRGAWTLNDALIQASPAYFVALDRDLRVVLMNGTLLAALGYSMGEVAGADYVEMFVPEYDRERRLRTLRRIAEEKLPTLSEGAVLARDGREILVKWHGSPVLNDDGSLDFFFGLGVDVTAYKEASDALEQERDDAQQLLDVAGVMFVALDSSGHVRRVNRKGCELLGAPEHDIVGKDWFASFVPERLREDVRTWFEDLVAGRINRRVNAENPVLRADGQERLIEWHNTILTDSSGNITGTLSSGIDITDRRRAEEIQRLAYRIGAAAHDVQSTRELFATIHEEMGTVMNAENFFIALYDREADTITLPYFVDTKDQDEFDSFPAGKTLTAYVLRNDTSLLIDHEELDRWTEAGIVERIGSTAKIWLGVPLRVRGEVIGALVVQSYTDRNALGEADREMLEFVSGQIGLAIERKRSEVELRESEQRNRAILDAIPDLMFQLTADGTFMTFDAPRGAPLAMAPEDFVGRRVEEIFSPEFAEQAMALIARALETGQMQRFEYSIPVPYPNGQLFDFENRIVPCGEKTVLSVVRDITESKRAHALLGALNRAALAMERTLKPDEVLAAASRELRNIGIGSVVGLVDEDGASVSFVHVDGDPEAMAAAESLIKMPMLGASFEVDSSQATRPVVRERRTIFIDDAKKVLAELASDEDRRHLARCGDELVGTPRAIQAPLVADDRVIGVLGVGSATLQVSDVPAITAFAHQLAAAWRKATLLEELESSIDKLERTQDQLLQAQKMEAVGRLAGGVAHDFNNLLTAMKGYAELTLNRPGLDEQTRADIEQIHKAGDQAASLTKQLLAFSRRQPLEPKVIDLNEVVVEMDAMLRRLIGEDIEFRSRLEDGGVRLKGDPGQIEQVIINLVVNARDAMPDGGRLTIESRRVSLDEAACLEIHDARPGEFVCLAIQDSGSGIPKDIVEQIFEPFFSTKGPGKGTGLGLSVVYGVIRQHEGWISVYSEPGEGTVFKVYLPAHSGDEVEESVAEPLEERRRGSGQRILLVEDEEAVRTFATRALRENGYVVCDAASADEALDIFDREAGQFDVVFSDVVLPGLSGIRLVDRLLSLRPDLEVLLSSGYTDQKSQWPAIREKGFRFLQKPYSLPDLLGAIEDIVRSC